MEGLPESVQILLQAGADTSVPGKTALVLDLHLLNISMSRLCNLLLSLSNHARNLSSWFSTINWVVSDLVWLSLRCSHMHCCYCW